MITVEHIPNGFIYGNPDNLGVVLDQCYHRGFVSFEDAIQIDKHLPTLKICHKHVLLGIKYMPLKELERIMEVHFI